VRNDGSGKEESVEEKVQDVEDVDDVKERAAAHMLTVEVD
jgi:hypothetical protein